MNKDIIVVKQLPVIQEQLQQIKTDVTKRVESALSLVCTEDTVKSVKAERAELSKEFKLWEEKRKEVKKAVMTPYEQFEMVYRDCVSDIYKQADSDLKNKISRVEDELKQQKTRKVLDYFNEYLCSVEAVTNISLFEFVTFEKANINVTLSASLKSLTEQAKSFIDRICEDINLIGTQEHKDEIFYEYKKTLNVSNAITTVVNRYKAIEKAKAEEEERKARYEACAAARKKVETVVEELAPPTVEPIAPLEAEEKILTVKFTVKGTLPQLKTLKEFLNNGGYDYE